MAQRENVVGVTIDAPTTRDLDDAIWVSSSSEGWTVVVSIADVARAILPGSDLDQKAQAALETRYLAGDKTRPMLPWRFSEDRLSLWPKKPKQTMSLEIKLNRDGTSRTIRLFRSLLQSQAKLTYEEIPTILQDKNHPHHNQITEASRLAMLLLERRRAQGAFALYDLNTGWVTTEEGYLRRLKSSQETVGYIIVQELMVLANSMYAAFAVEHDIPILFRNHEARSAAPDRSDLIRQLDDAVKMPLENVGALQQRVHMLLNKAFYGEHVYGHYGLNLPAYTHCTSPIRRYVDLINQRQFRAHLKGEPFPYSTDNLATLGQAINDKLKRDRESMAEHMKAKAERQASIASDSHKVASLSPKELERLVKVQARSGMEISAALAAGFEKRLRANEIPLICVTTVITDAPKTSGGWQGIRVLIMEWLMNHPEHSVSILAMASQTADWPLPVYKDQPVAGGFEVTASLPDQDYEAVGQAGSIKMAKQLAAVNLLAFMCGEPPVFMEFEMPADAPSPQRGNVPLRTGIVLLNEWCQRTGNAMPSYTYKQSGPSHMPTIECTCSCMSITATVMAGSKKEAKQKAAEVVWEQVRVL